MAEENESLKEWTELESTDEELGNDSLFLQHFIPLYTTH
jgi:hypothetical protein